MADEFTEAGVESDVSEAVGGNDLNDVVAAAAAGSKDNSVDLDKPNVAVTAAAESSTKFLDWQWRSHAGLDSCVEPVCRGTSQPSG